MIAHDGSATVRPHSASSPMREKNSMIIRIRGLAGYLGPFLWAALYSGMVLGAEESQFGTPKGSEGTRIFRAVEHPHYTGQFRIGGQRAVLVGSMSDVSPWDHLDYTGKHLSSVQGTVEIDVNELTNTGKVIAEFLEGTDRFRILFDRFSAKAAFQDGGIATRIYEHGDSGNGDPLYPKTWLYLAGWGWPPSGRTVKSC